MSRIVTIKDIIDRATAVHKDRYDYSLSNYAGYDKNIIIICKIHGQFEQTVANHLAGKGCRECGNKSASQKRAKSTSKFIEESKLIHNNKYDYSLVIYQTQKDEVEIICPEHGSFWQTPKSHRRGHGCIRCAGKEIFSLQEFVQKCNIMYQNKYNYSLSVYDRVNEIKIICPIHGVFEQLLNAHIIGKGCDQCGITNRTIKRTSNTNDFIEKANKIHNNTYDYSMVDYKNNHTLIKIICSKHGIFRQLPHNHLLGKGCIRCTSNSISKIEVRWLEYINIPRQYHQSTIVIENKKYKVDAYDPNTNTVYEFYGDFWHGNPKIYKSHDFNFKNKTTFGELYDKTIKREKIILDAGYKLITMWEKDFKKIQKSNRKRRKKG